MNDLNEIIYLRDFDHWDYVYDYIGDELYHNAYQFLIPKHFQSMRPFDLRIQLREYIYK